MRKCLLLALTLLFILNGCVELCGQRISMRYDKARDQLRVLIFYDGIHESVGRGNGEGKDQIPEFVKNGDIMLFDWIGHLQMKGAAESAKSNEEPAKPALRKLMAGVVKNIKTSPLGWYRDPRGRIGAAQLVIIDHASEMVQLLNAYISEQVLESPASNTMARSREALLKAARDGHQWVTLDGNALRGNIPVDLTEYAGMKAEFLAGLFKELKTSKPEEDQRNIQILATAVSGYRESAGKIEFWIGVPDAGNSFRLPIRDDYENSLGKVVQDNIKPSLHEEIATRLLNPTEAPPAEGVADVIAFGPPEVQAHALLEVARKPGPHQSAALDKLGTFAEQWNKTHGHPQAPEHITDPGWRDEAWEHWVKQMQYYPKPLETPPAATQPGESGKLNNAPQPEPR